MRSLVLLLAAALLCCLPGAFAADPTVKTHVEQAWQARELPLRIGMGQSLELSAVALPPRPGYLRVLRLQARLDAAANSGWNTFLGLELNGQKVYQTAGNARTAAHRVLNRDLLFKPPGMESEELVMRDNRLNVIFAPDFKQFDRRVAPEGEEAFWYVMDLSDVLSADQPNTLRLTNTARPVWFDGRDVPVVLGEVALGYLPVSFRAAAEQVLTRRLPAGQPLQVGQTRVLLTRQGGLAVIRGGEHYLLETSLTWPDGALNWLACPDLPKQAGPQEWRVTKAALSAAGGQVVAEGRFYRLTRTLRFDQGRLRLADTLTNRTTEDLGVELSYHLSWGRVPRELYLAGFGDAGSDYVDSASANPTLFAGQERSGLGLVCEDDLLRNQLRLRNVRREARAYSSGLGLAPGASYTCEWSLYPMGSNDYWDFINRVRRDWNVNFTIQGPFAFFGHCTGVAKESLESLRERTSPRQVLLATMHPWTNYQYPYSREEHRTAWRQAQAKVRQIDPAIRCLLMMEPPLESRVHQDRLPDDPYRDAFVINPDGKPAFDLHYGPNYVGKEDHAAGWRLVWRYPTLTNSWLRYLEQDVDFAMKDCGADGMYIDCFSYGGSRSWCRYTYDRWDGHTVDLDPASHRIARKYADLALLSAPAQQRVVERIQGYGGTVVANSEPCTRNMRALRVNRFVETGGGAREDAATHLYTPIALGFPWYSQPEDRRNAEGFVADVIDNLGHGALYYYYGVPATGYDYGVVNRMFPFTPRELHAGWLVGEERIITAKPGSYGWSDGSGATVYHYDRAGKETELALRPRRVGKANVWDVKLGQGEVAILVRARR